MIVPTSYVMVAAKKIAAAAFNAGVGDFLGFLATTYPRCHVYNAAGQVLPDSATYNLMGWDTEVYDTDGMHQLGATGTGSTSNSRIVFTTAGLYEIDAMVCLAAATYTDLKMQVNLNGGGVIGGGTALRSMLYDKGAGNIGPFTFCRYFDAGDYIEVFVSQVSGGTKTTAASTSGVLGTRVFARWIATT